MSIKKLYIELSSVCNLKCKMCFRNSWFDEVPTLMSDTTINHVKSTISDNDVKSIFFGGMGEPLLHNRIFELIKFSKDHKKQIELITNATLLTKDISEKLVESGIDTLWISMDGFTKESYETIRKGSLYQKIIDNVKYFNSIKGNIKLGLTFVMMKENLTELNKINDFADKYGFDYINLSHVVPCEELKRENAIYDSNYRVGKMHRFSKNENYKKQLDYCPFIGDEICFIRSDGKVCPCMQLLHSSYSYLYEEKRKIHSHSFGNINEQSLSEIYNSNEYVRFREKVKNFDFPCCTDCFGCEDRKENLTDCMYNERPTCGACLWVKGYIRCP